MTPMVLHAQTGKLDADLLAFRPREQMAQALFLVIRVHSASLACICPCCIVVPCIFDRKRSFQCVSACGAGCLRCRGVQLIASLHRLPLVAIARSVHREPPRFDDISGITQQFASTCSIPCPTCHESYQVLWPWRHALRRHTRACRWAETSQNQGIILSWLCAVNTIADIPLPRSLGTCAFK